MIRIEPYELDFELNGYKCTGFYDGEMVDGHLAYDHEDGYVSNCEIILDQQPEFEAISIMYEQEDGYYEHADDLPCIKEMEAYFLEYVKNNYEMEYIDC